MENLDSVMRRIAKLLAIAQDDRANPAEAASAASMAEKIMRKYQIDNASVIASTIKKNGGEEFNSDYVYGSTKPTEKSKTIQVWANWLAAKIAIYNDCKVEIRQYTDKKQLVFSGYKPDVEVCKYLFGYIVGIMEQSSKGLTWEGHGREYMSSYRQGFVLAVCKKFDELIVAKKQEMEAQSDSRALVVLKSQMVEQKFGVQKWGKTKEIKARTDGFMEGRAAGSKVDINRRGITANSSSAMIGA